MLKETGQGNWEIYLDRIGLFFIFTACAGISLIVWIFNWICWLNQCCCCDFLHNPVNKRIAWWMSFSFLLGILACCISAFVSVNRFGFALEGAWCAVDRIYYDSLYGQLKNSEPKWEGFSNLTTISNSLSDFYRFIGDADLKSLLFPDNVEDSSQKWDFKTDSGLWIEYSVKPNDNQNPLATRYTKIINSLLRLKEFKYENNIQETILKPYLNESGFKIIKTTFLDDHFYYYTRTLKACLKILAMIYYCLLLIAIAGAGVSMMFYACLKRQGYLLTFMHVLWNVIRFFMFSFFLYGTAYGIGFLAIRDSIAYMMYIFNENLALDNPKLIADGKPFLETCLLEDDSNLKKLFDEIYTTSLNEFFTNYNKIMKMKNKEGFTDYGDIINKLEELNKTYISSNDTKKNIFNSLVERAGKEGGIFAVFDCGFLKGHLNLLYQALYDASVESRILSALSLTSSFFGAVAIYFFLLVMHHYNNELFFDTGKSIFTGFDGFGGGYKKKDKDKDPAYKKRKLRAEIELTSKNDEQSGYNDVRKNEAEED